MHMSEGFDFLGFHIQWRRKRGTNKWYVYTFIADRPIRSVKAKIRALTHRTSQQDPRSVLIRLNQIMRGWANYFKHAVCKHTFGNLAALRLAAGGPVAQDAAPLEVEGRPPGLHHPAGAVETDHGGRDRAVQPRNGAGHPVPLPRQHDPQPLDPATTPDGRNRGEPVAWRRARRVRRAAWGNGPGAIPAPRPRPTPPDLELAAIGSRDTSGQGPLTLSSPAVHRVPAGQPTT